MDKFIFSAILYEFYREILYITYNYDKEKLTQKDVKKITDKDLEEMKKSKVLSSFYNKLLSFKGETIAYLDDDFLRIIETKDYTIENFSLMIRYLDEFADYYLDHIHKLIDKIGDVLDVKTRSDGFKGEYPLYIRINESSCELKRAVLSTNAKDYLDKNTKKFGFKVTFITYNVPLKNYSFNGVDLREKNKKEITKLLDSSMNVNLKYTNYFETQLLEYKDDVERYSDGELSLFLDKLTKGESTKVALKGAFKSALISFLFFLVIVALILISRYVIKK